jgi:hypothetical protein
MMRNWVKPQRRPRCGAENKNSPLDANRAQCVRAVTAPSSSVTIVHFARYKIRFLNAFTGKNPIQIIFLKYVQLQQNTLHLLYGDQQVNEV